MKKIISQLVGVSYTRGNLDPEKVEKIATFLNRKMLKLYIKALKTREKQESVFVDSAFTMGNAYQSMFEDLYPDKKIIYNTDDSLVSGVKITNGDLIYEMSIRSALEKILEKAKENYD